MASEKCSVSCCGIHYPLARQFFTPARSSGLAHLSSSGAVFHKRPRSALVLVTSGSLNLPEEPPAPACARWARQFFSWVVSELITFLPHNQLAFPNSQFGDLRHSCPPSARPRSAHFQTNFLRCAKHMQILLHQSCPLPTPQQLLTLQTDFNLI